MRGSILDSCIHPGFRDKMVTFIPILTYNLVTLFMNCTSNAAEKKESVAGVDWFKNHNLFSLIGGELKSTLDSKTSVLPFFPFSVKS